MLPLIISSLMIMTASLIGVVVIWKSLGRLIERNLHFLVSFSAGVFIIITYELSHEAIEHVGVPLLAILWIALGAVISLILFKILPQFHYHEDLHEGYSHDNIDARRIILGDGIHNLADGILLSGAFIVNISIGIATTLSIFIHEIVQEISEFFVLRQAGLSTKKALLINFSVSSTILIGSIGGYLLLDKFEALEAPLLGITAGVFLVIIANDLIPHSIQSIHTKKHIGKHILWFVIGLAIMFTFTLIFGHE